MKRHFIIILLLIFCGSLYSQDHKFKLGVSIYPNICNSIIINDGSVPGWVENEFNKIESWKPSLSANIFVDYEISAKSVLFFGLGYQNTGKRNIKMDVPASEPWDATYFRIVYNHHNIEIPVNLKYYLSNRFYSVSGVSGIINIINKKKLIFYNSDGSRSSEKYKDNGTSFRRFNFSGNLGVGYDLIEVNKFVFFIQPYFQYTILGLSNIAPLNRHPFSAGVVTGFKLK